MSQPILPKPSLLIRSMTLLFLSVRPRQQLLNLLYLKVKVSMTHDQSTVGYSQRTIGHTVISMSLKVCPNMVCPFLWYQYSFIEKVHVIFKFIFECSLQVRDMFFHYMVIKVFFLMRLNVLMPSAFTRMNCNPTNSFF